jgi:ABC-type glycerol-3-phosphate transport system substrate-binding protein
MFDDPGAGPLSFELGVTELPYINDSAKNCSFVSLVGAFWFPKTCQHLDEAYQFARFICNGNFDKGTYMPVYTGADMKSATATLTTYTDTKGTLHENIYPYETALAAVSAAHESYISYYKNDPQIYAKYVPRSIPCLTSSNTTFVSGEVTLDQLSPTCRASAPRRMPTFSNSPAEALL